MSTSRVSRGFRTTIPRDVRRALGLRPGDAVEYAVVGGRVELRRLALRPEGDFACFEEWAGEPDRIAYADP